MPFMPPANAEVFLSDDATSVSIFRQGQFQVELYLIHPSPLVNSHEHPGVEVIKMRIYHDAQTNQPYGRMSAPLRRHEKHGEGMRLEGEGRGFILVAIQHWLDREPNTVAAMWKGRTVGPKHEALIRRFNPHAYIQNGYADITETEDYRERLSRELNQSKS